MFPRNHLWNMTDRQSLLFLPSANNWFFNNGCHWLYDLCNSHVSCKVSRFTTWTVLSVCVLQEKPAKGRLFHSQKNLAELEERCEHPWRDLFLWAVLQNRQQMANFFWAMVSPSLASFSPIGSSSRSVQPRGAASFNQWQANCAERWQKRKKEKRQRRCAKPKLKWDELYPASLYSVFGVNMSNVGQCSAGAGQPCHMKMSLQIKRLSKRHIYQELGWTKKLSYLQEHYSNEGHGARRGSIFKQKHATGEVVQACLKSFRKLMRNISWHVIDALWTV